MTGLRKQAETLGISLSDRMLEQFRTYEEMLLDWNGRMNLTAITDHGEILVKHFLDSLYLLHFLELPEGSSLIDVGTGAGFPGIPLKIARPDLKLTLLDSLQKRVGFLQTVSTALEQDNRCIHGRAEDVARDRTHRECYDYATARAVAALPMLCEYCLPFVRNGGAFLSMKGSSAAAEVDLSRNAVAVLGGSLEQVVKYQLPGGDERGLVVIKKVSETPTKYPRIAAKIKKNPL